MSRRKNKSRDVNSPDTVLSRDILTQALGDNFEFFENEVFEPTEEFCFNGTIGSEDVLDVDSLECEGEDE